MKKGYSLAKLHKLKLLTTLFCSFIFLFSTAQESYLLVGTYDSPKSEGIYVYKFNSSDGSAKEISHVKTSNPSFLAISPNEKYVYAVNENADSTGKGGRVSSFSFDKKTGTLSFLSQQSSEGNYPCYISADKTGKWIVVANYGNGILTLLPTDASGIIGKLNQKTEYKGSGSDTIRQKSPHVHAAVFNKDNTTLYVTDLGSDNLNVQGFNSGFGILAPRHFPRIKPGSGPRHLDLHPSEKFLYLLQELAGRVDVFAVDSMGRVNQIQEISSLPQDYKGTAGSADIHVSPDGKFLYCSNRAESNTIAIFSIDKITGKLTLVGHQSTLGKTPRNFNFDPSGKFLLVANQNSDEIVIFNRDQTTGLLTDTKKRIAVGRPVCLKWVSPN